MIIYLIVGSIWFGHCSGQFGGAGLGGAGAGAGGAGGCTIDPKCFAPCPDYTLADAYPFVRQTPISCDECLNLCNKLQPGTPPFTCASVVYDASVQSCDIFAVADQGGGGGGGQGGFRARHKRAGGKAPHRQQYRNRIYLQPTGACAGQAGGNQTGASGTSTTPSSGGAGGAGSTDTTTSSTTSTTTAGESSRKKFKAQKALRKDDSGVGRGLCLVGRGPNGVKDCSRGASFARGHRQECLPTKHECDSQ